MEAPQEGHVVESSTEALFTFFFGLERMLRPHLQHLAACVGLRVHGDKLDTREVLRALADRKGPHGAEEDLKLDGLLREDFSAIRKALNRYHHGDFGTWEGHGVWSCSYPAAANQQATAKLLRSVKKNQEAEDLLREWEALPLLSSSPQTKPVRSARTHSTCSLHERLLKRGEYEYHRKFTPLPERAEVIERSGESKVILRAPSDTISLVPELETVSFWVCGGQQILDQIPYVIRCIQEICTEKRCYSHVEVKSDAWGLPVRCDVRFRVWLPKGSRASVEQQLASIRTRQFPASQATLVAQIRSELVEPRVQITTFTFDDQVLLVFVSSDPDLSTSVANRFKHVALDPAHIMSVHRLTLVICQFTASMKEIYDFGARKSDLA